MFSVLLEIVRSGWTVFVSFVLVLSTSGEKGDLNGKAGSLWGLDGVAGRTDIVAVGMANWILVACCIEQRYFFVAR